MYDGLKQNTSINELILRCGGGSIIYIGRRILEAYQTNNNLSDLCVLFANLEAGGGDEIKLAKQGKLVAYNSWYNPSLRLKKIGKNFRTFRIKHFKM